MKTIIVVECISSSVNYINDIRREGYEPIALLPFVEESHCEEQCKMQDIYFSTNGVERPRVVMAARNYADTLEMVKGLDPVLIIPGGDDGIVLATQLSADLGLTGNPVSSLPAMRDKKEMQEALRRAGLRYIRSRVVKSVDEVMECYHEFSNNGMIVIKPVTGGGTIGVHVCSNEDELIKAYNENIEELKNEEGSKGEIMIQEYIGGEEYVVDTLSCRGRHTALFNSHYNKTIVPGYGPIYNYEIFSSTITEELRPVCEYALKAVEAIGITDGPVHGEYKVDENGPVLIEVNCRPYGGLLRAEFMDSFLGHHETNVNLGCMLHPESFSSLNSKLSSLSSHPVGYGMISTVNSKREIFVKKMKIQEAFGALDSFFYELHHGENCLYHRSVDLRTAMAFVYLSNKNFEQLLADNAYIQRISAENPELMYESDQT